VNRLMTEHLLRRQNAEHAGTGGRSDGNRGLGFRPAFFHFQTQAIHLPRFGAGRLAPFHLLDGLPEEVIVDRAPAGRVVAAKASRIAGFERHGYFYTRTTAARAAAEWVLAS